MFAHRSSVIPFTKITTFPYSEQVQDIELYGTSVGDDFDAVMNYLKHIKQLLLIINGRFDA